MKKSTATFRDVGSFIVGILAGLAIGVLVFAMMDAFPDEWQPWPVFGASCILALGIALQVVATYKTRLRVGHLALLHTRIVLPWRDVPMLKRPVPTRRIRVIQTIGENGRVVWREVLRRFRNELLRAQRAYWAWYAAFRRQILRYLTEYRPSFPGFARRRPNVESIEIVLGGVLYEPGSLLRHIYMPTSSIDAAVDALCRHEEFEGA